MGLKYRYTGDGPTVLPLQNIEVSQNGDVIEVEEPIDNIFFVPVPDENPAPIVKQSKSEEVVQ